VLLTQKGYADHVGTTRVTINKKVKSGSVILTDEKLVDTENPVNIEFEEYIRSRRRKGSDAKKTGRPVGQPQPPKVIRPVQILDFSNGAGYPERPEDLLSQPSSFAEQVKTIEAWMDKKLKNMEKRGELVQRKVIEKLFSRLFAVHQNQFLVSSDRIANMVAGLCGVNEDAKILELSNAVQIELYKTLAHIKRLIDDFLKGLGKDD